MFKAVFDVAKAPEDPSKRNPYIETAARFLNMHVNAGVPVENLKVRMAMHGQASYGLLKNEFYKEKYGVDNPNIGLLEALDKAGVESYQITLGGDGTETTVIGERMGPGFSYEEIVPAVARIIDRYLELRENEEDTFLETYRRLGAEPFKDALYSIETEIA